MQFTNQKTTKTERKKMACEATPERMKNTTTKKECKEARAPPFLADLLAFLSAFSSPRYLLRRPAETRRYWLDRNLGKYKKQHFSAKCTIISLSRIRTSAHPLNQN